MARAEDFIRNSARNQLTGGNRPMSIQPAPASTTGAGPSGSTGPSGPSGPSGPTGSNPPVSGMEGLYPDMPAGPGIGDPYDSDSWSGENKDFLVVNGISIDEIIRIAKQHGDPHSAGPGNPEYLITLMRDGMYDIING